MAGNQQKEQLMRDSYLSKPSGQYPSINRYKTALIIIPYKPQKLMRLAQDPAVVIRWHKVQKIQLQKAQICCFVTLILFYGKKTIISKAQLASQNFSCHVIQDHHLHYIMCLHLALTPSFLQVVAPNRPLQIQKNLQSVTQLRSKLTIFRTAAILAL